MNRPGDRKIADLLVACGLLEPAQADLARAACAGDNSPGLLEVAARRFQKDETALLEAVAGETGLAIEEVSAAEPPAQALKAIPAKLAQEHRLLPLRVEGAELVVAVSDPFDLLGLEDVRLRTGLDVRAVLACDRALGEAIEKAYAGLASEEAPAEPLEVDAGCAEIERIVNAILLAAVSMNASHIHIEPVEDPDSGSKVALRYRVDGKLVAGPFAVPWAYRNALGAKLKILSNSMSIVERRLPQSGRIEIRAGAKVEFRVECLPTVHGEAFVLTVLVADPAIAPRSLDQLGILPDTLEKLLGRLRISESRHASGLILLCGPSRSGKTTTLHALIGQLNKPDLKLVTAEHPVERVIPGVLQVPVNPDLSLEAGSAFNFAAALRAFARFDPDVVLVGELRDQETALLALELAASGKLLVSTLHSESAPAALARLSDMGIDRAKLAAGASAVLALRLARLLCPSCKIKREASSEEIRLFEESAVELARGALLCEARPGKCPSCRGLGFKGRLGIHELLAVDDGVREALAVGDLTERLRAAAQRQGMRRLEQDALEKVKLGLTTVREALDAVSLL